MKKSLMAMAVIIIFSSTFQGCFKSKTIVLNKDVKKEQIELDQSKLKVDEKIFNLKGLEERDGFFPSFWYKDKVIGEIQILGGAPKDKKEYPVHGFAKKNFYIFNTNNGSLKETNKELFDSFFHKNLKEVNFNYSVSKINYFDFEKNKNDLLIMKDDLFHEYKDKYYKLSNGEFELVDGNNDYMIAYTTEELTGKGTIKLLEIKSKKLHENSDIGKIGIRKVVYMKYLKKFIAIDAKGQCYKLNIKGDKIELKELSKIDLGDLTNFKKDEIKVLNDSQIVIFNKNGSVENNLIKYDFKNNQVNFLFNIGKDQGIKISEYYPKQNILILQKEKTYKLKRKSVGSYEDVYLAQIVDDRVEIFYKIKNTNKNHEYYGSSKSSISENGDEIIIMRSLHGVNEEKNELINIHKVIGYYKINRN